MATVRVAIDRINNESSDLKVLNTFAEKLRKAGHTVTTHGRGPNKIQRTMLKSSNKCDIMIQVAGGKCLGTLVDFYKGLGKYYHANAGGFAYYKCWDASWKAKRAHDDKFSKEKDLAPYNGKTLPEIYKSMDKMYYGYGTTAEACADTWLQSYQGNTGSTGTGDSSGGGGSSILELIKQVCNDWDKYGIEIGLDGDTGNIKKTNPASAVSLGTGNILTNSISYVDYDGGTPNSYNGVKDNYLVERFGEVPLDFENTESIGASHVLQVQKRGHGHSIDLKVIIDKNYQAGKWVKLTLPQLDIKDRPYFITKATYDEDRVWSLTLEDAPPSRYVDVQEVTEIEEESTDEESEE